MFNFTNLRLNKKIIRPTHLEFMTVKHNCLIITSVFIQINGDLEANELFKIRGICIP